MRILPGVLLLMLVACQTPQPTDSASPIRFQLAAPQVQVDSMLFTESASLSLELDQPGVEIYFAIDQEEVSREDTRYEGQVELTKSSYVSVRAFHPDFEESDIRKVEVRKLRDFSDARVTLSEQPVDRYSGSGPQGLVDMIKGGANFGSDAWMGFQTEALRIKLSWDQSQEIRSVTISTLDNHGSWIFSPVEFEARVPGKASVHQEFDGPSSPAAASMDFVAIDFPVPVETNTLELDIFPLQAIPEWHDGRGTTPWLFIDEIIIN